ncbi:hypothetical protein BCF11_5268 [Collimonas sp. PA-H2]|nr:hypothetical protein BCF11_5268 [Collimonas sp. PA-H2]
MIYVDFNELVELNLVLLSVGDSAAGMNGVTVVLQEGMRVDVYMDDLDEKGNVDNLTASGVVEKNAATGWGQHVKWCCRIDSDGIRPQSEIS